MTEITKNVTEKQWKSFLETCSDATIYHTPEWQQFIQKTFNYDSHYLFALDESGNITGILPLFHVKSRLTGNRLCCSPFSHTCGYIGSTSSKNQVLLEAKNIHSKLNTKYLEIRDYIDSNVYESHSSFSTYILELSSDVNETWLKLDKKSARWAATKSKKLGVQSESTTNIEDLRTYYELNCVTKKDIGVPCHPWKFFKNMFEVMNEYVSLYVAKCENEIIGGGIFEYYNNSVLYGYGAADPNYLNLHPYNSFIWKSIEDSCLNGYKQFDFGRTSSDNKGLINFKRKWGTVENKLSYNFYPENPSSITDNRENAKYKYGTKAIQNMPLSAYKMFSNSIFCHFG